MSSNSVCNRTRDSTNRTPATRSSDFVDHSYDYRPNWTPLSPITIINCIKRSLHVEEKDKYELIVLDMATQVIIILVHDFSTVLLVCAYCQSNASQTSLSINLFLTSRTCIKRSACVSLLSMALDTCLLKLIMN